MATNNNTTLDCTHLSADDHLIVILSRWSWTRITFYYIRCPSTDMQKHPQVLLPIGSHHKTNARLLLLLLCPHRENDAARRGTVREETKGDSRRWGEDGWQAAGHYAALNCMQIAPYFGVCTLRYFTTFAPWTDGMQLSGYEDLFVALDEEQQQQQQKQPSNKSSIEKRFMQAIYIVPYIY